VWRKDLQQGKVEMFIKPNTGGLDAPSALLIEGEHLFVGNRKGKSVCASSCRRGSSTPIRLRTSCPTTRSSCCPRIEPARRAPSRHHCSVSCSWKR
jgi:hypothetical protein